MNSPWFNGLKRILLSFVLTVPRVLILHGGNIIAGFISFNLYIRTIFQFSGDIKNWTIRGGHRISAGGGWLGTNS